MAGIYRVQTGGKAPSGLQVGDQVVTGGGTYKITGVNSDGSYKSSLVNAGQTIRNYNGGYSSAPEVQRQTVGYNAGTDYQALINNAVSQGNYQAAALYERARNNKIAGEGLNVSQTNKYASYLPAADLNYSKGTDYQGLINNAVKNGDYQSAAKYEQLRNAKIAGEGLSNPMTNRYSLYLGQTDDELQEMLELQKEMELYEQGLGGYTFDEFRPYESQYKQQIDELAQRLLEQTYDRYKESDEYKALEQKYLALGNNSMEDTMAQIAARTGGLVSSYGEAAAQQSYAGYLQDLEQAALNAYNAKRAEDENELARMQALEDSAYAQYANELAAFQNQQQLEAAAYENEMNRRYNAYQQQMASYAAQGEQLLGAGIMPSAAQLNAMGWTQQQAQDYLNSIVQTQEAGTQPTAKKAKTISLSEAKNNLKSGIVNQETMNTLYANGWTDRDIQTFVDSNGSGADVIGAGTINDTNFKRYLSTVGSFLSNGQAGEAQQVINTIWGNLTATQKARLNSVLTSNGYDSVLG